MSSQTNKELKKKYKSYLAEEVDGIFIYRQLAEIENDSNLVEIYNHLAESEQRHVDLWQEELAKLDTDNTLPEPSLRAKVLMWVARKFSPDLVLPVIKAFESDAASMYVGDSVAELEMLPADEASHARVFAALESSSGASGNMISRLEQRHTSLASRDTLRAGVLGASDGLVSNMLLVAGFAGANPSQETVVLAGFAGLLAGSISMGLGEWISVTTTKEAAQAQIAIETEELRLDPDAEKRELELIYQAKGVSSEHARVLVESIFQNPDNARDTMVREELGINLNDIGSPWKAALSSFLLFSVGAIIPVIPFLFGNSIVHILIAGVLCALGLFALGSLVTLLTGQSILKSGFRQMTIGVSIASLTFAIGWAIESIFSL
jgi:VIT1/CCC1 family predicted Fe2+/Mn2+ transporter/rubrerythrin